MKKKTNKKLGQTTRGLKRQSNEYKSLVLPPLLDKAVVRTSQALNKALKKKEVSSEKLRKKAAAHRDVMLKQLKEKNTPWAVHYYDYPIDLTHLPPWHRGPWLDLPEITPFIPAKADWKQYPDDFLEEPPDNRRYSDHWTSIEGVPFGAEGEASASSDDGTVYVDFVRGTGTGGMQVPFEAQAGISAFFTPRPDYSPKIDVEAECTWEYRFFPPGYWGEGSQPFELTVRVTIQAVAWYRSATQWGYQWKAIVPDLASKPATFLERTMEWQTGHLPSHSSSDKGALTVSARFRLPQYVLSDAYRVGVVTRLGLFAPISFKLRFLLTCHIRSIKVYQWK
jgi:hypothetical protein